MMGATRAVKSSTTIAGGKKEAGFSNSHSENEGAEHGLRLQVTTLAPAARHGARGVFFSEQRESELGECEGK